MKTVIGIFPNWRKNQLIIKLKAWQTYLWNTATSKISFSLRGPLWEFRLLPAYSAGIDNTITHSPWFNEISPVRHYRLREHFLRAGEGRRERVNAIGERRPENVRHVVSSDPAGPTRVAVQSGRVAEAAWNEMKWMVLCHDSKLYSYIFCSEYETLILYFVILNEVHYCDIYITDDIVSYVFFTMYLYLII